MAISDDRQRVMPMLGDRDKGKPLAYKEVVLLTDPTNVHLKGEKIMREYNLQDKGHSQHQTYALGIKELYVFLFALSVVNGINASIFAYGQTSSRKTFTMGGVSQYTIEDIYDYAQRQTGETTLNETCSRCHQILRLVAESSVQQYARATNSSTLSATMLCTNHHFSKFGCR